jgi:Protein of unknown function (DUF3592)
MAIEWQGPGEVTGDAAATCATFGAMTLTVFKLSPASGDLAKAAILASLGLFTALSLAGFLQTLRRMFGWPAATGTVIAHEPAGKDRTLLTPVVTFQTPDGTTVRGGDRIATRRGRYPVGRRIRLHYDARNPSDAVIGYRAIVIYGAMCLWFMGFTLVFMLT